ncbi:MAG: DUF1508 domain-containing protein [Actinomycetota bacterium]|jgi:uncharacterized protein
MAAKFEIEQPKAGEFRWVLTSQGRVLARSENYTRKVSCVNAMESFRKAAPTAEIVDHTARPAKSAATSAPAKVARQTGRVVGKAAAKVAEVPSAAMSAVEKVVDAVTPGPRRRTRKAT